MNGPHRDHDLEQVLARLRTWEREAKNFRNDGYVAEGNRKRIEAVRKVANSIMKTFEERR